MNEKLSYVFLGLFWVLYYGGGYLSQYLQTIGVRSKIDSLASCLLFEIGVAIKTRGFIDLMVSLGLLIPAKMAQLAEPEKS